MPWTMVPVFSSIVTVSLVHFMRNLRRWLLSARPALVGPHVAFALQFSMRQALREGDGRGLPDELHFGGSLRSALSFSRQEDWYGEVRRQVRRWVYCTNVAGESSSRCQSVSQSSGVEPQTRVRHCTFKAGLGEHGPCTIFCSRIAWIEYEEY